MCGYCVSGHFIWEWLVGGEEFCRESLRSARADQRLHAMLECDVSLQSTDELVMLARDDVNLRSLLCLRIAEARMQGRLDGWSAVGFEAGAGDEQGGVGVFAGTPNDEILRLVNALYEGLSWRRLLDVSTFMLETRWTEALSDRAAWLSASEQMFATYVASHLSNGITASASSGEVQQPEQGAEWDEEEEEGWDRATLGTLMPLLVVAVEMLKDGISSNALVGVALGQPKSTPGIPALDLWLMRRTLAKLYPALEEEHMPVLADLGATAVYAVAKQRDVEAFASRLALVARHESADFLVHLRAHVHLSGTFTL